MEVYRQNLAIIKNPSFRNRFLSKYGMGPWNQSRKNFYAIIVGTVSYSCKMSMEGLESIVDGPDKGAV